MATSTACTSIRLEIQKIKDLPPLPVVAQQLLAAINDESSSIDDIAKIIQADPILTSRILGLANSAFFGFNRRLYNLTEAIVNVLGLNMVRALGLTMVMGGVFDTKKCYSFDIVRHWSHAFMTAELAMRFSRLLKSQDNMGESQFFLYGLLHNFGILVLVDRFPQLMDDIFVKARSFPERRLIYTEQNLLDMDHHQAGAWLAHKWRLPDDVSIVIENHHYPEYRNDYWQEASLIGVCSRIARTWVLELDKPIFDENEREILAALEIEQAKLEKIVERCQRSLGDIQNIANQMAS